jgi:hypothetical protein
MIIFYKNYKRDDRTFLSIQSVRYLFPNIDIKCLLLYDNSPSEYDLISDKLNNLGVELFFDKKTYNFGNIGSGLTYNGYYFTEGINKIQKIMKNYDGKVLILDEDCYFTKGSTIDFLLNNDYDLAWCNWPSPLLIHKIGINGSTLSINPKKLDYMFPIPELNEYIEDLLGVHLYDRCLSDKLKTIKIPTRDYFNFHGDGTHTNDINEIKNQLKEYNIPYSDF